MTRHGAAAFVFVLLLAACSVAYLPSDQGQPSSTEPAAARLATAPESRARAAQGPARRVGSLAQAASGHCLQQECPLGNLLADAVLAHFADVGAVAAILPSRTVRGFLREGEISNHDVDGAVARELMSVRDLRGAELRAYLEEALKGAGGDAQLFPQVAGLRYVWSPNHPPGRRLISVQVADRKGGFEPLVNGRPYRVALNGGSNAPSLASVDAAQAFTAYLERRSPVASPASGRIVER